MPYYPSGPVDHLAEQARTWAETEPLGHGLVNHRAGRNIQRPGATPTHHWCELAGLAVPAGSGELTVPLTDPEGGGPEGQRPLPDRRGCALEPGFRSKSEITCPEGPILTSRVCFPSRNV